MGGTRRGSKGTPALTGPTIELSRSVARDVVDIEFRYIMHVMVAGANIALMRITR